MLSYMPDRVSLPGSMLVPLAFAERLTSCSSPHAVPLRRLRPPPEPLVLAWSGLKGFCMAAQRKSAGFLQVKRSLAGLSPWHARQQTRATLVWGEYAV